MLQVQPQGRYEHPLQRWLPDTTTVGSVSVHKTFSTFRETHVSDVTGTFSSDIELQKPVLEHAHMQTNLDGTTFRIQLGTIKIFFRSCGTGSLVELYETRTLKFSSCLVSSDLNRLDVSIVTELLLDEIYREQAGVWK